ncbi:hypothetical protein KC19_8G139700, partial [Ceratodon purpureus]
MSEQRVLDQSWPRSVSPNLLLRIHVFSGNPHLPLCTSAYTLNLFMLSGSLFICFHLVTYAFHCYHCCYHCSL